MEIGYLGGIVERGHELPRLPAGFLGWRWGEAFLHAGGSGCRLFDHGDVAVLLRGSVRDGRSATDAALATRLVHAYRADDTLAIDGLEGSFTLALLDGRAGILLVYRNLVGDHNTYYRETSASLLFGSNLADALQADPDEPRPNNDDLPTLFLNRTIPGRNTLFAGWHRLLPGEQLTRKQGRVFVVQRQTFADLREARPIRRDALDRLEAVMGEICADYHAQAPNAAGLLSGGVDSSFVQLHWNRARGHSLTPAPSYCVAVDHERTQGDREYAESASARFGTRHRVCFQETPYAQLLIDALTTTGELPNHVQLALYPVLAQQMANDGVTAALNGDGADSLFGLATGTSLQNAAVLRRLLPTRTLRRGGIGLAGFLGWGRLRDYLHLADHLHDYERLDHPVNRAAVFADWPAVERCFGREAVANVTARRRELLDRYAIPETPLDRLHAAGFLGSAMNTAALTTTMYARHGVRVFTPFLDSRMLRFAVNLAPGQRFPFRRPKEILKKSLARHGFEELAYRTKKSFGQPIFEWLAPGGELAPFVERIDSYPFVDAASLQRTRAKPTWFLYSLLCYDLWHKTFLRRAVPLAA